MRLAHRSASHARRPSRVLPRLNSRLRLRVLQRYPRRLRASASVHRLQQRHPLQQLGSTGVRLVWRRRRQTLPSGHATPAWSRMTRRHRSASLAKRINLVLRRRPRPPLLSARLLCLLDSRASASARLLLRRRSLLRRHLQGSTGLRRVLRHRRMRGSRHAQRVCARMMLGRISVLRVRQTGSDCDAQYVILLPAWIAYS
jgi:hypothetical protein